MSFELSESEREMCRKANLGEPIAPVVLPDPQSVGEFLIEVESKRLACMANRRRAAHEFVEAVQGRIWRI